MIESASLKNFAAVPPATLGRYEVLGSLARGGMASVYLGRHSGGSGFQRLYAIKVLHPHLAEDADFVNMLLDEARIAARLHHPNVVPVVDLGTQDGLHYIVMEYVEGASLSVLLAKNRESRPPRIIASILLDALAGLHAAHSLTDDDGQLLNLVHRDVSPQNVMVGVDGTARIVDFGIAKAEARIASTRPGELKGKFAYMAPEQVRQAAAVDARVDVFAAGALAWSALTGVRLFLAENDAETINNIMSMVVRPPSTAGLMPPSVLDPVIMRALERDLDKRFASAAEMEEALQQTASAANMLASKREVADWVTKSCADELSQRRKIVRAATGLQSSRDVGGPQSSRDVTGRPSSVTPAFSGTRPIPPTRDTPALASAPILLPESEDIAVTYAGGPPPQKKRTTIAIAAAAFVALVALGIGVGLKISGNHESQSASASSSAAVSTPIAQQPVQAATSTDRGSAIASAPPSPPSSTAAPQAAAAIHATPIAQTYVTPKNNSAWHPAPQALAPAKSAAPVTTAAPPTSEPRKKAWDNDSPLPP